MIILLGSFLILRNEPDFDTLKQDDIYAKKVLIYIGYIILGSLLLIPVPIFLFTCCKSKYTIIKAKSEDD